jgi:hypothetical protein
MEDIKTRIQWLKNDLHGAYIRLLDKYFPDRRTYIGEDFAFCATDNWGDPCPDAELNYDDGVAICRNKRRTSNCWNRKLLETESESQQI